MTIGAEFRSKCPICGEWIEEGDLIRRDTDGQWAHEECALDQEDES